MITTTYSAILSKSHTLRQEWITEGHMLYGDRTIDLDDSPTSADKRDDQDMQRLCSCHGYVLPTGGTDCEW